MDVTAPKLKETRQQAAAEADEVAHKPTPEKRAMSLAGSLDVTDPHAISDSSIAASASSFVDASETIDQRTIVVRENNDIHKGNSTNVVQASNKSTSSSSQPPTIETTESHTTLMATEARSTALGLAISSSFAMDDDASTTNASTTAQFSPDSSLTICRKEVS